MDASPASHVEFWAARMSEIRRHGGAAIAAVQQVSGGAPNSGEALFQNKISNRLSMLTCPARRKQVMWERQSAPGESPESRSTFT